jgi:hypothetical protein
MMRNMMIARMNLHHHKVHFPRLLPLMMMAGKMRPISQQRRHDDTDVVGEEEIH